MYAAQGSTDLERSVLSHYNLSTPFPNEWPTELDQSDDEDEDNQAGVRRSRSRYSALERAASDRRTFIPGSQRTRDGKANVVQKDEADPLGGSRTVITSLKHRGLPVDQDARLRNRFLLSSTTFSPALFLSQTHSDASTNDLIQGLRYLEQSIDQKSASLKVLVETNFERFVRAKATIDNVYTEMRNQGMETASALSSAQTGPPSPRNMRHSRQVSRNSGLHQRITSTGSAVVPPPTPSKNALRKESEYGVKGVKGPLLEVSQRAEDVWGPALGSREREATLKAVAEAVTKDRVIYELGAEMAMAAQQKNYERVVELHSSARSYASQATAIADSSTSTGQKLTDDQVHRILVTGRMWSDVQDQVNELKKEIWRRLSSSDDIHHTSVANQVEEHMELISILLELGVEDNPIWVWLLSRYDSLKNKISAVTERSKVEIEILRRRLAGADPPSQESAAAYLRMAGRDSVDAVDAEPIIDFWKTVSSYVNKLLSMKDGLLGEIVEFWESAKSFIDGNKQKALPVGFEGESRRHHRLSETGVRDLSAGAVELVGLIRDSMFALFAEGPTEDISAIFSPMTNGTPKTPATPMFSPSEGRLGNIDETSMPPASPRKGDAWEDFAFWPPHSNGLSAVQTLSKILSTLAVGAGEMIAMEPVFQDSVVCNNIRALVNVARSRCLSAVCMTWSKDSVYFTAVEDWLKSPEKRNQTRLPTYFAAYEQTLINGIQQILYLEGNNQHSSTTLVAPPSSNNVQLARQKFTDSIFALLSGMLQNAERPVKAEDDEWVAVSDMFKTASGEEASEVASYNVDASNRNVRMLLTISNVKGLKSDNVPQLIRLFETSFSIKLGEEITQINNKFADVDKSLFQSYTKPAITYITQIIKEGINSPEWEPSTTRPDQVSPYVYASLMVLVNIHTEVTTTVPNALNSTLLQEILSYLLENMSQALLDGFKERKPNKYSLAALIQATLDTEFIAQTMSQYATKRVGDNQNEIYVVLDKRTTNEARADLQKELVVMKGVLKKLRESSRNSFGCFKRVKSGDRDRPKAERQQT